MQTTLLKINKPKKLLNELHAYINLICSKKENKDATIDPIQYVTDLSHTRRVEPNRQRNAKAERQKRFLEN